MIDEARAVKGYVAAHGVRTLLVVTSPYHSRRAVWAVRHVPTTSATPAPATWWNSRDGWRTVATEFFKLPYYWLAYGLN